jgi:hypothetical protein
MGIPAKIPCSGPGNVSRFKIEKISFRFGLGLLRSQQRHINGRSNYALFNGALIIVQFFISTL